MFLAAVYMPIWVIPDAVEAVLIVAYLIESRRRRRRRRREREIRRQELLRSREVPRW